MTLRISVAGALVLALAFVALVMMAGLDTTSTAEAQEPTATETDDGTPDDDGTPSPTSASEATNTPQPVGTPAALSFPPTGQGPGDSSGSSAVWIVAAIAGLGAAVMGVTAWRLRARQT